MALSDNFNITNQPDDLGIGPQCRSDPPFKAQMRYHQSWYRSTILGVPFGVGPKPSNESKYGNMLTEECGAKGLNFLTPQIYQIVRERLKSLGIQDQFRLLCNMLSSQPMCFNLFAPMVHDYDLASRTFRKVFPALDLTVVRVQIEFAPEPEQEYLNDKTAFDAFVEFTTSDGKRGFVGIETKLTEPFSQKVYSYADNPAYRTWITIPSSPWHQDHWEELQKIEHNQLWRDHLLGVAMRHHPRSPYSLGYFMLVRHPGDMECDRVVRGYKTLLKQEDETFLDFSLPQIVECISQSICTEDQRKWIAEFRRRYLDLAGNTGGLS